MFRLLWEVCVPVLASPPLEVRDCRHVSQACIPLTEKERKGGRKAWVWGGEGHVVNACRVSHTEGSPLGMEGPGRRRAQNGRRGCLGLFVPALHKWNRYEMKRQGLLVPGTIRAGSLWLSCTDHFEINRFGLGFFWAILRTYTNRIGSDCVCLPIDYILLFLATYKYTSNLPRIPPNASEMRSHTEVLGKASHMARCTSTSHSRVWETMRFVRRGKLRSSDPKQWNTKPKRRHGPLNSSYLGGHHGPPHQKHAMSQANLWFYPIYHLSSRFSFSQGF